MTRRRLDREALGDLLARPDIARVLAALKADGEETRLVGGGVRDALLRLPAPDIDLATTLLPDAVMARAAAAGLKSIPTGIEHGTVTILTGGTTFEVTTLREDVETDGRRAVVRFGRDFGLDAERRDFTINALSLDGDGRLHDTTGGTADLEQGRVRFIGDAATRIREDSLRILRFFRFHARYGIGAPDEDGLVAVVAGAVLLDHLSRERVRAELLKLLDAPGAADAVAIMSRTGLLARITGSAGHLDRFERAVARASEKETEDGRCAEPARYGSAARLAALAVDTEEDATRLREALRLSNEEHALLASYAAARGAVMRPSKIDGVEMRRLAATQALRGLALAVDVLSGPEITEEARSYLERLLSGAESAPVLPLSGADLVAAGVAPGRLIGIGLSRAREIWLQRGCPEGAEERALLRAHALEAVGTSA